MLQNILFNGQTYPFTVYDPSVNGGRMFGFITEEDGNTAVSNRIFEIVV